MKLVEKVTIEREIEVSNCLKCGGEDIVISDSGYSSFNIGGGHCNACGHDVTASVGCLPSKSEMVYIWNKGNDIDALIAVQEEKIAKAEEEIIKLKDLKRKHQK